MIKTLIIDDEPPARRRIRDLLASETDIQIVGESGDGLDAHEKIRALDPDLLFLDIKMPGLSGLQLSRLLREGKVPCIIFTTAYSEHAVDAFALEAVDYLLKPFDKERFRQALAKARSRMSAAPPSAADMERMVQRLSEWTAELPAHPPGRLAVKDGTRLRFFNLPDISHLRSDGDYLHIHVAGGEHAMIRERMRDMEQRLKTCHFVRISRSVLINFDHVKEMKPTSHGDYEFVLRGGERLASGKTYRDTVRQLLTRIRESGPAPGNR